MSDERFLGELRALYEGIDPVPPDLAERVLFALELEDVDTEFELLRLTERTDALVGARSSAQSSDATRITFANDALTVLLAIGDDAGADRRRLDGWVAPLLAVRVVLHTVEGEQVSRSDRTGRFVLEDVPAGMVRLVLQPEDEKPFVTPTVEI